MHMLWSGSTAPQLFVHILGSGVGVGVGGLGWGEQSITVYIKQAFLSQLRSKPISAFVHIHLSLFNSDP